MDCMKKILLLILSFMFLFQGLSFAVDLDQPMEKTVTLKTEIERGASIADKLAIDDLCSPRDFTQDISNVVEKNKQDQKDTDGFYLGIYFVAWNHLAGQAKDHRWEASFGYTYVYYEEFRKLQTKYEIGDEQLCNLVKTNYNIAKPLFDEYWDKTHTKN